MSDIGTLGGPQSTAIGINDFGHMVGSSYPDVFAQYHAFLYSSGVMIDLGILDGTVSGANA